MIKINSISFFLWIVIIMICVSLVTQIIRIYNRLVMLKFNVDKSFANIDILLKQRADEIPNLIKVVQASQHYEQDLLKNLTEIRSRYMNASTTNEKVILSNNLSESLKTVFAVSENYPDLKTNNNFMHLQKRVSELETSIADRREFYNESVTMYNIAINEFPVLLVAKALNYKPHELLFISPEEKKYDGIKF